MIIGSFKQFNWTLKLQYFSLVLWLSLIVCLGVFTEGYWNNINKSSIFNTKIYFQNLFVHWRYSTTHTSNYTLSTKNSTAHGLPNLEEECRNQRQRLPSTTWLWVHEVQETLPHPSEGTSNQTKYWTQSWVMYQQPAPETEQAPTHKS